MHWSAVFALVLASALAAQTAGDAATLMRDTAAFYASRHTLGADCAVEFSIGNNGARRYQLRFERPNRLRWERVESQTPYAVVVDGRHVYQRRGTRFSRQPAPTGPEGLIGGDFDTFLTAEGLRQVIRLLAGPDSGADLTALEQPRIVGTETIEGAVCTHVVAPAEQTLHHFYIQRGPEPWVKRYRSTAIADPDTTRLRIDFDSWSGRTRPQDFRLAEIAQLTQVEAHFPDLLARMRAGKAGPGRRQPTKPRPAPDLTFARLGGGEIALKELRGKVVVLDYWASWCRPCLQSLPLTEEVVGEFGADEIVLLAPNLREPPAQITEFLDSRPEFRELSVLLDVTGKNASALGVGPIPHLIVIDREGTIRYEHRGLSTGYASVLREVLKEVLK